MAVEFVVCPQCGQKLAVQAHVVAGSSIVCANPQCNTSLRVLGRKPIKVERLRIQETFNADHRPESYG
jgi:uncharacterized protein YbaR (Trm112 family)